MSSPVEPRQYPYRRPPWGLNSRVTSTTVTTILTIPGPGSTSRTNPVIVSTSTNLSASVTSRPVNSWTQEIIETDTMITDPSTSAAAATPTTTSASTSPPSQDGGESGIPTNKTLVITLSTVFSVLGLALVAGGIFLCWRYRQRRLHLFKRGISPIDDDEIATWKMPRDDEKARVLQGADTDIEADAGLRKEMGAPKHGKHASTSSIKKPPSVIVYANSRGHGYHTSVDEGSPRRSYTQNHPVYGRMSVDKALPQTPIQARAPNARAGLTDESIPGDEPYLPSPKRQTSRISKFPPSSASSRRLHGRSRSSRSSTRSFGEYGSGGYGGSDVELSPRLSHDHIHSRHYHSRVYSSSSIPPRLSLGDEALFSAGSSPARPFFRDDEIGRAIG